MLSAVEIAILHDRWTGEWHADLPQGVDQPGNDFPQTVLANHLANFKIWHAEDATRLPEASDHEVARAKRIIDRENQRRNDFAELCDTILLDYLRQHNLPNPNAELNTETPGILIDRLSILSLRLFHTAEEVYRVDAPPGHSERNRQRHHVMIEQCDDLVDGLDRLWQQVLAGQRRFKQYRPLKMYNDPTLNPALYMQHR